MYKLSVASLATLATVSGASTYPNVKSSTKALFKKQQQLLKSKTKTDIASSVTPLSNKESSLTTESHKDYKYFEIGYGGSCDPDHRGKTHTMRFNICVDYMDFDEGLGGSVPRSRQIVGGVDGGPPKAQTFMSHQCKGNPAAEFEMNPMEWGLPSDYTMGTCHEFVDGTGNVMYTGVAQYLTHRHTPNYSHVTFGYSNKDRFCTDEKLKLFEQEIIRTDAGICWDEEEDDGSKTYYKFDLTQCNDAERKFKVNYYGDENCATPIDHDNLTPESCLFDMHEFAEGIHGEDKSGSFHYNYVECVGGGGGGGGGAGMGAPCAAAADCASNFCNPSFVCDILPSGNFGDSCTENSVCNSNFCDTANSYTCLRANGEGCTAAAECGSNFCDGNGYCANAPVGAFCSSGADCLSNLCMSGYCRPALTACTSTADCSASACNMGQGFCETAQSGAPCSDNNQCDSNMCFPNTGSTEFVCQLHQVGSPCMDNYQCATNTCTDVTAGGKTCALQAYGEDCLIDAYCSTGFCDTSGWPFTCGSW